MKCSTTEKKSFISTSPGLAPAILVPTHTGKWIYSLISQCLVFFSKIVIFSHLNKLPLIHPEGKVPWYI